MSSFAIGRQVSFRFVIPAMTDEPSKPACFSGCRLVRLGYSR